MKSPALRLASWNVRTMRPGLTEDLQTVDDARKTDERSYEVETADGSSYRCNRAHLKKTNQLLPATASGKPPQTRVQHKFGGMRDEAKNRGGMRDTRNFKCGMRDENRTARPGYASFRRRDTG